MGDPKKIRRKYLRPKHPWQASRIAAERPLVQEYGLKNKKEIWKAQSLLKNFAHQAKSLSSIKTENDQRELQQLLARLNKLGLLKQDASREDVLGLNVHDILNRRLQTLLLKKELARTTKQARQLIVHGHIAVNRQKITIPSYLVPIDDENKISYIEKSSFNSPENPERALINEKNKLSKEEREVKESKKKKTEEVKEEKKEWIKINLNGE